MISTNTILNMLFFDLETVSEYKSLEEFKKNDFKMYKHWYKIFERYKKDDDSLIEEDVYLSHTPLYPEFSKILSISIGALIYDAASGEYTKMIKTVSDHDEKVVLNFIDSKFVNALVTNKSRILSGHNIVDFDIPFLIKRYIKHEMKLPQILKNTIGAKPWELQVFDSLKYWKFGGQKFTSLGMICDYIGIPSPKEELNGSMVNKYYWETGDLEKIKTYNSGDIEVLMNLLLKLSKL